MVPPDELEPFIIMVPPDELEPAILMVPPDELEPVVIMGAPEELELDEVAPVMVGDPDPLPEPDDVEAPEPAPLDPLDPKSVGPPLLEVDPFVAVPPDPEELAPPKPSDPSGIPEEHPATAPASPERIAKVVRRCIVLCFSSGRCPVEGLKCMKLQFRANCASALERTGLRDRSTPSLFHQASARFAIRKTKSSTGILSSGLSGLPSESSRLRAAAHEATPAPRRPSGDRLGSCV